VIQVRKAASNGSVRIEAPTRAIAIRGRRRPDFWTVLYHRDKIKDW
jgi:hypothetical protein